MRIRFGIMSNKAITTTTMTKIVCIFAILILCVHSSTTQASPSLFWKRWGRLFWMRLRAGSETTTTAGPCRLPNNVNDDNVTIDTNNISSSTSAIFTLESNATRTRNNGNTTISSTVLKSKKNNNNRLSILSPAAATYNSLSDDDDDTDISSDDDDDETIKRIWSTSERMTKKRKQFLERISLLSSFLVQQQPKIIRPYYNKTKDSSSATTTITELYESSTTSIDLNEITPDSDLSRPGRHFYIVTTAALPWFTGTAVNPTLRAAYLHQYTTRINNNNKKKNKKSSSYVTLVIPWLELKEDQETLYHRVFNNIYEQEEYIRTWLRDDAGLVDAAEHLNIVFYPARYHPGLGSIFAMGDIIDTIAASTTNNSNDNNDEDSNTLDVCILEEPEHCNWYRAPGDGWTQRFNFVVGIVHTNYKEYASAHYSGLWTAPAISLISSAMVRAYCHKVVKLSDTLQSYAVEKEVTSNVHGVRGNFWQEGLRRSKTSKWNIDNNQNRTQVYFVGKLLWAKGLDLLLDLEDYYKQYTGKYFSIDIYGSGPDQRAIIRAFHGRRNSVHANPQQEAEIEAEDDDDEEDWEPADRSIGEPKNGISPGLVKIHQKAKQKFAKLKETTIADIQDKTKQRFAKFKDSINSVEIPKTFAELRRQAIPAKFPGRVDHGELIHHKVFVNPSISEVLCTTTAEALAMGKFAIIPVHPSNTFFLQFTNCLPYRNKFEFVANLRWALTHDPEPLNEEQIKQFTWEAATERLINASAITWKDALERERLGLTKLDERIAWFHNEIGKGSTGDFIRKVLGAGPVSNQVKYQKANSPLRSSEEIHEEITDDSISSDDDDEEEEDIGFFAGKFKRASFVQAIRDTIGDMSSFAIQ